MNLKQKAITSTIWSIVQSWGSQCISLIVFSILARLLNPESFGLIALAAIFLGFVNLFLDQGFSTAIIQRRELEREHLDTAFWTNVSIAFLLAFISIASSDMIAKFFSQPDLTPVLRWLSLSFLIGSLNSVQVAILQRNLNFKPLAIRSLIATLGGGVIGVSMALMGFGVWSLVGQQLANGIIQVLVLWSASDWRPKLSFSRKHFRDLFSFGINILAINILNFLISNGDNLLIGYFLGPIALGYYNLAYRLLTVVSQLFIGVVSSTAVPIFSSIQDDIPRLRKVLYEFVELTNTIAFPIFLGMSVLAPELIVVVFGEQWKSSIPVMRILNLIGILYAGFYYNAPLFMAVGKPQWKLKLDIARSIFYLTAFFIAVRWGIVAVAASYIIIAYIFAFVTIWFIKQLIHIKIKDYLSNYVAPIIGTIIMINCISINKYFINQYWIMKDFVSLIIGCIVGLITYSLSIYFLKPQLFDRLFDIIKFRLLKIQRN
ncbi:lipopolysaccharide biosynthesis protein [Nodularia spumigena CENA596]|uniref:Lipopolysaccharide biosynthesis protein n=1 Tax=Nodularia spumigena CENA596 TaxID=1819295 RepID=A0A161USV4_NODSP|nr:MOP flippase family protein [Nodularia spumigena]KZL48953.1 lipopolysaccharide biosynthesis protein [Nodularia spumigena CENA596]